jgi:hypothetical protein
MSEFSGLLNLTGAETDSTLESGNYNCEVFEAEWAATKGGPDAKLPEGTPKLNVQFRVVDPAFQNRRLFYSLVVPPDDYASAAKMKGMLVNLLVALGYEKAKVQSAKFQVELSDLIGRACVVRVSKDQKYGGVEGEFQNNVKGVKPAGSATGKSKSLL